RRDVDIETVCHAGFKFLQRTRSRFGQLLVGTRLRLRFAETCAKVTQTRNCSFSTRECLESEIELLVVRHTQKKVAHSRGRKTFRGNVAKRVVVALRLRHRFAVDFQMFEVNPVTDGRFSVRPSTLTQLVS